MTVAAYTRKHLTSLLPCSTVAPPSEETELANCLVLSRPIYQDTGKKKEWTVTVHAQPSIFQPETDVELLASAHSEPATLSQRKSLKLGIGWCSRGLSARRPSRFPTVKCKRSTAYLNAR